MPLSLIIRFLYSGVIHGLSLSCNLTVLFGKNRSRPVSMTFYTMFNFVHMSLVRYTLVQLNPVSHSPHARVALAFPRLVSTLVHRLRTSTFWTVHSTD